MKKDNLPKIEEIRERVEIAVRERRGITISPYIILHLLDCIEGLALLASKTPQFSNPITVWGWENFRDDLIRAREMRLEKNRKQIKED